MCIRDSNEAVRTRDPLGALPYSEEKIASTAAGLNPQVYPAIDWKEMLFKDQAINHRFNFNISGGGKVARYYLSGSYSKDSGLLQVNGKNSFNNNISLQRMIMRATVNINMTKSTEVVVRMYGTFDDYTGPLKDGSKFYEMVMNTNPVMFQPVYQPDERYKNAPNILFGNAGTNADYTNPYAELVKGYKDYSATTIVAQVELKQNLEFITKGLNARVLANTNRYSYFDVSRQYVPFFYRLDSYDKFTNTYQLSALNEDKGSEALQYTEGPKTINTSYYLEAAVDYNRVFNEKHTVTGLLVGTMREYKEANAGSLLLSLPHRNIGLAGRATYSYDSRYFGELNFGYNGSERFAKKNRWGFFPSIGAGYIISNEHFYPESWKKVMNKLKLKATYGLVGNDRISSKRFPYLTSINVSNSGATAWRYLHGKIVESVIGADNLKWEKAKKMDLGIEGNLWGKIDFTIDFFRDIRDGIFQERKQVPDFVGLVSMPYGNVGSMESWGSDGNISFTQRINKDMDFTIRGNFTYSTNKVKYFEEADNKYEYYSASGRPYNYQKGYIALGLFSDQEEIDNSPKQTFGDYMPGDIKYKDVNGDGMINSDDRVPLSYSDYPRLSYGFGGEFRWKKLRVGVLFNGIGNTTYYRAYTDGKDNVGYIPFYEEKYGNILTIAADPANRWIPADYDDTSIPAALRENPNALFPRLSYGKNNNNSQTSTFWQGNRRYLRLQELSLYYTLDLPFVRKCGINNIDLAVIANNLYTWDTVDLFDPDQAASNGRKYPIPGRVSFQATITF